MKLNSHQIIAHRGYPSRYPENSLIGIRAAIKCGANFVEFDVQCSKEGTLYVYHDASLLRTSNQDQLIHNCSDKVLQQLSSAYCKRFNDRYLDEPIPTLKQVVNLLQEYPHVHAFIEPKQESLSFLGSHIMMQRLLRETLTISTRQTIISYSQEALEYTHAHSSAPTAWVLEDLSEKTKEAVQRLKPKALAIDHDLVGKTWPQWVQKNWIVHTVNQKTLIEHYLALGASFVETDYIGEMLTSQESETQNTPSYRNSQSTKYPN